MLRRGEEDSSGMTSEVHELRCGKNGSIRKKNRKEHSKMNSLREINVHKGSNQIKALQTLWLYIIYSRYTDYIFNKKDIFTIF